MEIVQKIILNYFGDFEDFNFKISEILNFGQIIFSSLYYSIEMNEAKQE